MKGLRFCAGLLTVAIAFYSLAGCERNDQQKEPAKRPTAAQPAGPSEELVEKIYQAKLGRYEETDTYYLQIEGSAYVERNISDSSISFKDKIIGKWGGGMATENYPSSYVLSSFLELLAGNRAKSWGEKGHEEFVGGTDRIPPIKYVMDKMVGPYWGTWKITGDETIEIRLYLPKNSQLLHPQLD